MAGEHTTTSYSWSTTLNDGKPMKQMALKRKRFSGPRIVVWDETWVHNFRDDLFVEEMSCVGKCCSGTTYLIQHVTVENLYKNARES